MYTFQKNGSIKLSIMEKMTTTTRHRADQAEALVDISDSVMRQRTWDQDGLCNVLLFRHDGFSEHRLSGRDLVV
ncbi:unnamed protein product [Urochloa humidicola]